MTYRTRLALLVTVLSVALVAYQRFALASNMWSWPTIWEATALLFATAGIVIATGKEGLISALWHFIWRDRARIAIRFSAEPQYTVPPTRTEQRFRFGVFCDGPAEAKNTTLQLVSATKPRAAVRHNQLPFQVARDGAEWITGFAPIRIPLEPVSINPGDEQLFEPIRAWVSSEGKFMVGRIDTKPGGRHWPWPIEPDEVWELAYVASAANSKSTTIKVRVSVADGKVCVENVCSPPKKSAWSFINVPRQVSQP